MSVVIAMEAVHTNVSTWQVVIDVSVPMDKQAVIVVSICYDVTDVCVGVTCMVANYTM